MQIRKFITKQYWLNLEKSLLFISIISFVVIILMLFLYIPKRKKTIVLENKWKEEKQNIEKIKSIFKKGDEKSLNRIKEKYKQTKSFFPEKPDKILKFISTQADLTGINIISLQQKEENLFVEKSKRIKLNNKFIHYMPVNMRLNCSYKKIADYLKIITFSDKYLVRINEIQIGKPTNNSDTLNINLELLLYYKS